jgi:hypothetical protein
MADSKIWIQIIGRGLKIRLDIVLGCGRGVCNRFKVG